MSTSPVILITGASSGFGEATARRFARAGYRVVLAARRQDRLQALADEIRASGGEALPVVTDMAKLTEIQALVQTVLNHYGQIDILFNNAGFGRLDWLETLDPLQDIASQLQVNLLGLIWMAQAVLPHMIERRSGRIINMASVAGLIGTPTYSVYAASKFGVRGFSEALRREVHIHGIHVSAVYPGGAPTEFQQHVGNNRLAGLSSMPFLKLTAEDVANAVLRLTRRPRRTVVLPWPLTLAYWFNTLIPGVLDWAMEWMFVKKEKRSRDQAME